MRPTDLADMGGRSETRDRLAEYRRRRDAGTSPEPSIRRSARRRPQAVPIFVVQQHDASSRHWDFRLEVDGVLRSWAVPKGPSTDPREKRLAVATEDHPLEYADFEGVIPEDQYGAGTVIVWDTGPYVNVTTDDDGEEVPIDRALAAGRAEVRLEGEKLYGGFALIHAAPGGRTGNWLLVKMKDQGADARRKPVRTQPHSVISGRSVEEVARAGSS